MPGHGGWRQLSYLNKLALWMNLKSALTERQLGLVLKVHVASAAGQLRFLMELQDAKSDFPWINLKSGGYVPERSKATSEKPSVQNNAQDSDKPRGSSAGEDLRVFLKGKFKPEDLL